MALNPRSTASIAGHPIHPMLVPFPIAFFVGAFLCDLAFWQTTYPLWATAATWLLGAGLISAALAALVGFIDFFGEPRIRDLGDAWWHAGANIAVVVIEAFNWYTHFRSGAAGVVPLGLAMSFLASALLLFSGWKGGELVFRHRVAVLEDPKAPF